MSKYVCINLWDRRAKLFHPLVAQRSLSNLWRKAGAEKQLATMVSLATFGESNSLGFHSFWRIHAGNGDSMESRSKIPIRSMVGSAQSSPIVRGVTADIPAQKPRLASGQSGFECIQSIRVRAQKYASALAARPANFGNSLRNWLADPLQFGARSV